MGFKNGAYAKVWEVRPRDGGKSTIVRLSISKKDKNTGNYEQEFSDSVFFVGDANQMARGTLTKGARIKIDECDVKSSYDKEKKLSHYTFTVWKYSNSDGAVSAPTASFPSTVNNGTTSDAYPF